MAVRLSLPAALTTVEPGTASGGEITVANPGTTDEAVRLEVRGEAAEWGIVLPPALSVPAGGESVARLVFHVPRATFPPAGLSSYCVVATSTGDAGEAVSEEGFVVVSAFTDTAAELVPPGGGSGPSEYGFRLSNRGNVEIRASITAVADDPGTGTEAQPSVLVVPPGENRTASVRVTPRRRLLSGGNPHRFRVSARADGAPAVEVQGSVAPKAGVPPWLVRIVAMTIASMVAGLLSEGSPLRSDDRPSPREVVAEAGQNTVRTGRSGLSVDFEFTDPASASGWSGYRLEGVMDYRRNVGRFTLDLARSGLPVSAGPVEVIRGASAMYFRIPGSSSPSRPWLRLGDEEFMEGTGLELLDDDHSTAVLAAVTALGSAREALGLEELAEDVTPTGRERIRGASTKSYHLALDAELLSASLLPESGGTIDTGSADVWVDDQGRARRIRMAVGLTLTDPEAPGSGAGRYTMEFFDFGTPVAGEEPPADMVLSPAELYAATRE